MKKVLFTVMLALVFCLTAFAVSAKEYHIYTAEDMNNVRNDLSGTYYLMNDIDLSVYDNWEPINGFSGKFDGQGYKITGLNIDVDESSHKMSRGSIGLFGFVHGGTIKNLGVEGKIEVSLSSNESRNVKVGGIVSHSVGDTTITNCYTNCSITLNVNSFGTVVFCGGLAGSGEFSLVENCYTTGNITANINGNNSDVVNSIGGLIGANEDGLIKNCFSLSNIKSTVKGMDYTDGVTVGGLIGFNRDGSIESSYATGTTDLSVEASKMFSEIATGGFVGFTEKSTINCYFNKDNGSSDSFAKGLTTSQMQSSSSFSGFDFENVWAISPNKNNGYPCLRSVPTDGTPMFVSVFVNGKRVSFDVALTIIDGRTLVPLRAIFESLGATVEWDDSTKTVTGTRENTTIEMTVGQNTFTVNNEVKTLDVPSQIIDGRTLVPVRAISESFGVDVEWHEEIKTVCVKEKSFNSETVTMTDKNGVEQQVESFLVDLFSRVGYEK